MNPYLFIGMQQIETVWGWMSFLVKKFGLDLSDMIYMIWLHQLVSARSGEKYVPVLPSITYWSV